MSERHTDAVKRAVEAINASDVPEDLRAVAFGKVLDSLLADAVEPVSPGVGGSVPPAKPTASGALEKIASATGIDVALLDRVYDLEGDEIHFSGDVSKVGTTKIERVSNIGLMVIAALRWSGLDGGANVADSSIRAEIDRLGLYDVTNYTKHLAPLKPFVTIYGSGKTASYKIKFDGTERAKRLSRQLAGVPDD